MEVNGQDPSRGWHIPRIISKELSTETATKQVGSVTEMVNNFCFSTRMKLLLTKALHAEGRPDETTALHLVFKNFWIVAFKSCYLDAPARVREARREKKLQESFNNRRKNQFKGALKFHSKEITASLLSDLKGFFDVEAGPRYPRLLDHGHEGHFYFMNKKPGSSPTLDAQTASNQAAPSKQPVD
eukprot:3927867-Pleurochrysis_carterae.AAC.1